MLVTKDTQTPRGSVRRPVLLGLFTGTAIGAGYLLAGVPNVELMSLVIALAGGVLGAGFGALCGAVAMTIYSLGSPYGAPVPLLLAAQAMALASAGVLGALAAPMVRRATMSGSRLASLLTAGACGLLSAFLFDALTNLAILGSFDLEPAVVFWGAVPFFLVHGGVNAVLFAVLLPTLLPRLAGLVRSPLVGRSSGGALIVAVALLAYAPAARAQVRPTAPARPDTVAAPTTARPDSNGAGPRETAPAIVVPVYPTGWVRPLWHPFLGTLPEEMAHRSPYLPVIDGGLGAPALLLGETGTSTTPLFVRDGVPLGTGHALADDPWLIPAQGSARRFDSFASDGWGGTGGRVDLTADDPEPGQAISHYAGRRGPHETYLRGVSLLTPDASWRAAFDFEESLDNEGYNYTDDFDEVFQAEETYRGHAKIRLSHLALTRQLDKQSRLTFHYHTGRKTRDSLPVWGAEHQEVWDVGWGVRSESRSGAWLWRSAWFWNDRDVEWGDRDSFASPGTELRLIETAREGGSLAAERDLGGGHLELRGRFWNWELLDTGADWTVETLEKSVDDLSGDGQQARAGAEHAQPVGPLRVTAAVDLAWDSRCDPAVDWSLRLEPEGEQPAWRLSLAGDGRTPRSDEWLTPVRREIGASEILLLPNPGLDRERNLRAGLAARRTFLGVDLAVDASWVRLRDGISWVAAAADPSSGTWENGLDLDGTRVTASAERGGHFLGWTSLRVEGTWRSFEEKSGQAPFLAPEQWMRLRLGWENHFFSEDGVVQMALLSTRRGAMDDPWDVTRTTRLPAIDQHDLLLGFRLVGVHLSLAYRNLLDQRLQLSAGSLSPGREMDMRLYWMFRH